MNSKITLSQVSNIHIGKLADLPADQLMDLQQQAADHFEKAKRLKEWIDAAISIKYQNDISLLRNKQNKATGSIYLRDGSFKVTSIIPKKVDWDQEKLKDVVSAIKKHGDNVDEYVETSYKISETKYSAWPEHIKNIFKPARVVRTGKESFKIEANDKEVDHE